MKYSFSYSIIQLLILSILWTWGCKPSQDGTYSTLIRDVLIVDGSGKSPFTGSLRFKDGLITEIGNLGPLAKETVIEGNGMALAPGFIDTHSHHDWDTARSITSAISQGITTIIIGQDGNSRYPLQDYFQQIEQSPLAVNVASYVGHNSIRREVMGEDYKREANSGEIEEMKQLIQQELLTGALGLSTGLEYDPGIYSSEEEVIQLAIATSAVGGRYISHMRSEDRYLEQSIEEIINIGKQADIPVQISHFKLGAKRHWGKAAQFLAQLDQARSAGVNITADVYPYEYWQSTMTVLFPERDFDNRAAAELALTEFTTPEGMIIAQFNAEPAYEGKTLAEIAKIRNEDPADTYMTLIAMSQQTPGESIIAKSMTMPDIKTLLAWQHSNLCSDGAPRGHPRGWGAFPKYYHMSAQLPLETRIAKMTTAAAHNLGLKQIGQLKAGNYADLVLFDPQALKDRASFDAPTQRSEGIMAVWVSGELVLKDGTTLNSFPGRLIKRD